MEYMFYTNVKVPLQQNNYDCGIFLLIYVEEFFKQILKFKFPRMLWFEQSATKIKIELQKNILILIQPIDIDLNTA